MGRIFRPETRPMPPEPVTTKALLVALSILTVGLVAWLSVGPRLLLTAIRTGLWQARFAVYPRAERPFMFWFFFLFWVSIFVFFAWLFLEALSDLFSRM